MKTGQISATTQTAGLAEAREQLRVDSLPDDAKRAYYRYMDSVKHMCSLFDSSRDDGYVEGHAEGMATGRAEGLAEERAEGLAEGRAEGIAKTKLEIAQRLLSMGLPIEQAAQGAGLSVEEVEKLVNT